MLRKWHALPGMVLALVLAIAAGTGAILAGRAALDAATAPEGAHATISLAALMQTTGEKLPGAEKITRTPSGRVRVTHLDNGVARTVFINPQTGATTAVEPVSPVMRTITNLHRAWLGGDGGRLAAGLGALAMLMLSLTGLFLLKRAAGGWAQLLRPLPGAGLRRWHLELGRIAVAGLLLSATTALHMSLVGFEVLGDGTREEVLAASGGDVPPAVAAPDGLATLTLADLREIALPGPEGGSDPIIITTSTAVRLVDAATGRTLREDPHSAAWHIRDIAYRLHTAEGMPWLALVLGIASAAGAVLAITGLAVSLRKRLGAGRVAGNVRADAAQILLLVGSEGGSTLGFARTLHQALTAAGCRVHLAPMNDLPNHSNARKLIVLAASAGEGEAPASASRFLEKLAQWQGPRPEVMVLGFGDSGFARFCAYADQVEAACRGSGFPLALPGARIDRQSCEAFAAWGDRLARHLGLPLQLRHAPSQPGQHRYCLVEREDFGAEVQAPTAILRLAPVRRFRGLPVRLQEALGWMPRFEPGDLVAISPPGDPRPRFYSIASSSRDGLVEICVRHQPGGACSGYLCDLAPGMEITAAIRPNPAFRPDRAAGSLILIGAGAGIAPLVGFVREARQSCPVHLYWGGRHPASDFLYREDLESCRESGRLTRLRTIFSRIGNGGYVQDLIATDAAELRAQIAAGGQILICGGRDMADGVRSALAEVLAPLGLDLATLRRSGRLLEDVY